MSNHGNTVRSVDVTASNSSNFPIADQSRRNRRLHLLGEHTPLRGRTSNSCATGRETLSMTGIGDNFRHGSTSAKTETSTIPQMGLACRVHTYSAKENSLSVFSPTCLLRIVFFKIRKSMESFFYRGGISRFVGYFLFFFLFYFVCYIRYFFLLFFFIEVD